MEPFVAFDVETANTHNRGSICQIGIVRYNGTDFEVLYDGLINPLDDFNFKCMSIHGIQPEDVENSPTFAEAWEHLEPIFRDNIVVAHNAIFDVSAIEKAIYDANIVPPSIKYVCTLISARYAFPGAKCGLRCLCDKLDIRLEHHNAVSDALACGKIALAIAQELNANSVTQIAERCGLPVCNSLTNSYIPGQERERTEKDAVQHSFVCFSREDAGCPDISGVSFAGKKIVFTGELFSMPRDSAESIVRAAGGECVGSVSKKVDFLIVGRQDTARTKGSAKSTKQVKAEQIIAKGGKIMILSEEDFLQIVADVCERECEEA